jgi:dipeptidyl aminopeptidase/acylaminoacyl peptidase
MHQTRSVRSHALTVILLVLGLAWPALADETFTPWHVANLRVVGKAVPSPDGSRIAYVLSVPRDPFEEPDGAAWEELHVVNVATGDSTPFVTGQVNVREPRWRPDGKAISFLARRGDDKTRSLYVIPVEGGEARRALAFETDIRAYDWHPDGRQGAFVAEPKVPEARAERQKKGFTQEVFEETLERARVWIARVDGEDRPPRELRLDGHATEALWSPDGRRLAVVLAPTPLVDDDLMNRRVHVVDAGAGTVVANLRNPGKLERVAWSPDGRHIAIVSGEDLHDPAAGRLMVRPVAGGAWTDLIPGYEGHVRDIAWIDADRLAYVGDEGVETVVAEVRRDGTARRTVVPAGQAIFTAIEASGSGTLALQADTPRHPPEVYALTLGPGAQSPMPKRLTDSNPWLASMRFAPQEVVTFAARDGLELQGILVRPLDARPGQRYPLILTVHGGPEAHDRNGWRTGYGNPGQFGAAAGFAVFHPNYRGSTGRGVAFSTLGQADAAGKEFDDLVDAVDHLVNIGLVDTKKVGITGGSYGGYATAWASTYHTERFAAGVMFVGISNKVSKIGTTDIAEEEYLVHARTRVWENWEFFLQRSPVYHAAKSRTPLLIMHGKDDPRVHPTQSLELYRHLKLHGKTPVRLVWYPGEGHGNRRAAARLDYSLRMLRWFEHYLQGPGGAPPPPELEYERPGSERETTAQ